MKKKIKHTIIATLMVMAFLFVSSVCAAEKRTPFKLNTSSIVFNTKQTYQITYVWKKTSRDNTYIVSAISSKPSVAKASVYKSYNRIYNSVQIEAKKPGKSTVTVKDNLGRTAKVNVTVKKSWPKANLKYFTYTYITYYDKTITLHSKPKTKVTLRIGGDTYKKKTNNKGQVKVRLKRHYKVNQKYSLTAKNGKYKTKITGKVYSNTYAYFGTVWSCKPYVPVTVYNVVKGDTIILSAGGRTYRKKIPHNMSEYSYIFDTKYDTRYYNSLKITVKNKYKQKTYSRKWKIDWR